jgi:hypothetical protein
MSVLVILLTFVVSLVVTLTAGGGWAFVTVYIPSLLMLNQLPEFPIPHAPLVAHWAALYGIILGVPFRKESLRFRWCSIDTIMVLLLLSATITAWSTEVFETGINSFRTDLLQWTAPYFLARIVFRSVEMRRATLYTMVVLIGMISVAALIEFRLTPYWYLHVLRDDLGMHNPIPPLAYHRYGFFRVSGTVFHPIYFGNLCVALFGAFGCVVTSISFTPYMGLAAGTLFFLTLMFVRWSRLMLVPLVLLVIAGGTFATYHVAQQPLGTRPDDDLGASLYIRQMIVIETWHKAIAAGPFGFGLRHDFTKDSTDDGEFDLSSIDNSYMQFTMTRGWVYTALWLSIAVFFSARMTLAFSRVNHRSQVFPLAVCTATVLGLMVSMYTVWAGAIYTVFWLLMLGLANTLIDLVVYPELRQIKAGQAGAIPTVRTYAPSAVTPGYGVPGAAGALAGGRGAVVVQRSV